MRKICAVGVLMAFATLTLGACAADSLSPRTGQGAAVGGGLGAVAGALIDKNNRWRGAVIGGVIGAVAGGTLTEISARAGREAAQSGRAVSYESTDGFQRVEAEPVASADPKCKKVRERVYQEGKLMREQIREICE